MKRTCCLLTCLIASNLWPAWGQERVSAPTTPRRADPALSYQRWICVLPLVGTGTYADPRRPLYLPAASTLASNASSRQGILGYSYRLTDTGLLAVVQIVAADRASLQAILGDQTLTGRLFDLSKTPRVNVESALQVFKKGFRLDTVGVTVP